MDKQRKGGDELLAITLDEAMELTHLAVGTGSQIVAQKLIGMVRRRMSQIDLIEHVNIPAEAARDAIAPPAKPEAPAPELVWRVESRDSGMYAVLGDSKGRGDKAMFHLSASEAADIANALNAGPAMAKVCEYYAKPTQGFSSGREAKRALALYGAYGPDGELLKTGVDDG